MKDPRTFHYRSAAVFQDERFFWDALSEMQLMNSVFRPSYVFEIKKALILENVYPAERFILRDIEKIEVVV